MSLLVHNRSIGEPGWRYKSDRLVPTHFDITRIPGLEIEMGAAKLATNLNYYSYRNNQPGWGTLYNAIPVGASVRLVETGGDPVGIRVLSKSQGRVQVEVSWGTPPPTTTVSGRVLDAQGRGLRNATVRWNISGETRGTAMTSSLGYFSFSGVPTGVEVVFSVGFKRYRFSPITRVFAADVTNLDLTGLE